MAATQIDSLTKRISANRAKVNQNKGVPGLEAEVAKLEESIRTVRRRGQESLFYLCTDTCYRMNESFMIKSVDKSLYNSVCGQRLSICTNNKPLYHRCIEIMSRELVSIRDNELITGVVWKNLLCRCQ